MNIANSNFQKPSFQSKAPAGRARRATQLRPEPAAVTAAVTRGVGRWMEDLGFASLTEFKLGNGRRADVVGLNDSGIILMVEVKSTPEDFRGDAKWLEYVCRTATDFLSPCRRISLADPSRDLRRGRGRRPFGGGLTRSTPSSTARQPAQGADFALRSSRRPAIVVGD